MPVICIITQHLFRTNWNGCAVSGGHLHFQSKYWFGMRRELGRVGRLGELPGQPVVSPVEDHPALVVAQPVDDVEGGEAEGEHETGAAVNPGEEEFESMAKMQ